MKQNVNFSQFCDGFSNRKEDFTFSGLRSLFDYFEDLEDDIGESIEFDPISICCEYTEFTDIGRLLQYYPSIESMEDLRDHTQVIEFDDGIIIQNF